MPELERCPLCDAQVDPIALDEVLFHAAGACMDPDGEPPATGILGTLTFEPPQG